MIVKRQHRGSSGSAGCLPSSSNLRDIRRHRSTRTAQYDAETGWLQDREGPSNRQAELRRICLDVRRRWCIEDLRTSFWSPRMPWTTLYRLRRVAAGDRGVSLVRSCRTFLRSSYKADTQRGVGLTEDRSSNAPASSTAALSAA
jgi:hypothetical protein